MPRRSSRRRACARCTTTNPASRADLTVSRSRRQPPATAAQAGAALLCRARPGSHAQVDVLEQQQRPARDEDPAELGERRRRVGHRAERERAHGGVEARVRERQLLGAALDDGDARGGPRRPPPRPLAHGGVGLERGDRRRPARTSAAARRCRCRSRARARAPRAARRRRQAPTAARSNGHMTASYTAAWPPGGVEMRALHPEDYVRPICVLRFMPRRPAPHASGRWRGWPASSTS